MSIISDITELASACVGIGGLLSFVAWVIGSVINIIINTCKKG